MPTPQGNGVYRLAGTIAYTDTAATVEIGTVPAYGMATGLHVHGDFAGGSTDWIVSVQYNSTGDVGDGFVTVAEAAGTDVGPYSTADALSGPLVQVQSGGHYQPLAIYNSEPSAFVALFEQGLTPTTSGHAQIVVTYVLFDTP